MAYEQSQTLPQTEHHETVREQAEHLFQDLSSEMKIEIAEIRGGDTLARSTQADLFVRRHVMGLILILFGVVALILLIGIGAIAIHGHHPIHAPGVF